MRSLKTRQYAIVLVTFVALGCFIWLIWPWSLESPWLSVTMIKSNTTSIANVSVLVMEAGLKTTVLNGTTCPVSNGISVSYTLGCTLFVLSILTVLLPTSRVMLQRDWAKSAEMTGMDALSHVWQPVSAFCALLAIFFTFGTQLVRAFQLLNDIATMETQNQTQNQVWQTHWQSTALYSMIFNIFAPLLVLLGTFLLPCITKEEIQQAIAIKEQKKHAFMHRRMDTGVSEITLPSVASSIKDNDDEEDDDDRSFGGMFRKLRQWLSSSNNSNSNSVTKIHITPPTPAPIPSSSSSVPWV